MNLTRYVWRFRLFGVPVAVLPSFWFLCVAFSPFLNRIDSEKPWLFGLLGWTGATTVAFLLHELGHALAAKRCFGASPEIALGIGTATNGASVFGGVTSWRPVYSKTPTAWSRAVVSFAGPGLGLLGVAALFAVAFLCGCEFAGGNVAGTPIPLVLPLDWAVGIASNEPLDAFVGFFVYGFIWIGVFWGAINLAPIYPLDGGQITTALAAHFLPKNGVRAAAILSIVCAVGLAAFFYFCKSFFGALFFAYLAYQNYSLATVKSR
ncbi:MAG: hypothetical protein IKU86_13475 [Thermoguttaceae bacterium]|nr:hypothetical protein [Thermoguttaceae bacterium]